MSCHLLLYKNGVPKDLIGTQYPRTIIPFLQQDQGKWGWEWHQTNYGNICSGFTKISQKTKNIIHLRNFAANIGSDLGVGKRMWGSPDLKKFQRNFKKHFSTFTYNIKILALILNKSIVRSGSKTTLALACAVYYHWNSQI